MRFQMMTLGFIASCCFFVWIIFSLPRFTSNIFFHVDEIAWFIDTDVFEQLFLKGDVWSPFWQTSQRLDQPQVVKYIYGAYLWSRDANVFRYRQRLEREWGRWGIYSNPNTTDIGFRVFGPFIIQMRQINFVALIGTLLMFYLILIQLGRVHIFVAMIGTALLAYNSLFLQEMTHATHDGFMMFFLLASLLFYSVHIKNKKVVWMVIACLFAALSVASKLTGIIAGLCIWFHEIIVVVQSQTWKKYTFVPLVFIPSLIFVVWIAVNPTLYKNPIKNTIDYFSLRATQTRRLQEFYPSSSLTTLPDKVHASWCTTVAPQCHGFFEKGTITSIYWVNVSLLVLGLWYIGKFSHDFIQEKYIYLLEIFLLLVIVWNMVLLPMHYGRYYLPIQIGIFFVSVCGLEQLRRMIFWRK